MAPQQRSGVLVAKSHANSLLLLRFAARRAQRAVTLAIFNWRLSRAFGRPATPVERSVTEKGGRVASPTQPNYKLLTAAYSLDTICTPARQLRGAIFMQSG